MKAAHKMPNEKTLKVCDDVKNWNYIRCQKIGVIFTAYKRYVGCAPACGLQRLCYAQRLQNPEVACEKMKYIKKKKKRAGHRSYNTPHWIISYK